MPGHHDVAAPAVLRLLPVERRCWRACSATYVSTGLGVIGLAWQSSPALTEVEEVATDWMRQMLGLSEAWSGVINDTASTSTLVALMCARERATNYSLARGGLQAEAAAARRLHLGAQPQLGREGGAAGRLRQRARAHRAARQRRTRCGPNRSTRMMQDDLAARPSPVRRGGDDRHDDVHRARSARQRSRSVARGARPVAARRCGHGRLGDDPARVPLDVGGRRAAPTR